MVTLRDHTELQSVLGELDSARSVAESLRAQAHEYANRLHTIVTMVELGRTDEAVAFTTAELTTSQHLIDRLTAAVHEPALAALLLGKVTEAAQQGVELTVTEDTALGPATALDHSNSSRWSAIWWTTRSMPLDRRATPAPGWK